MTASPLEPIPSGPGPGGPAGRFADMGETLDVRQSGALRSLLLSQEFWVALGVVLIGIGVAQVSDKFASGANLFNVLQNFCFIALMAIGMTPVIISGGIDISVGSVLGLAGICAGLVMSADYPFWMGLGTAVGVGLLAGFVNGASIAYLKLPPFIMTLAMLSAARSAALVISDNQVIYTFGRAEEALLALGGGQTFGLPNVFLAVVVCAAGLQFALSMTRWGRYVKAIGGNAEAARATGIRVRPILTSVYMFNGAMAGLTAFFLVGWLGAVTNSLGQGDELRVIAGTVIGGANLLGGYGTAAGAVIGSLLIEVTRNALLLAGISPFWQGIFVGAFIFFAMLLERVRSFRL